MALRYNDKSTAAGGTGNLNTFVAGTTTGGPALAMGDNARQKVRNLSALVSGTAATATLTMTTKWQVSNDSTTWVDFENGTQNAAGVPFTTGTSAIKTVAVPAPDGLYSWRFARIAIVNGVATGAVGDTFSMGYCYRSGPAA